MDYQVSEQTRLRQLTVEIFVHEGLDGAINLDRESYNFAHPHYQFLVKWLHSAIRQFTNRQKAIGKAIRERNMESSRVQTKESIAKAVTQKLSEVGVDDVVDVEFVDHSVQAETVEAKREEGVVAFDRYAIFRSADDAASISLRNNDINQKKAEAVTQLLYGWGLLDELSHEDQARLVRDILEIVLMEDA